jgi:uncharacterized membrane protein YdjX (TVP38/TMEM64 family)
VTEAAPTGRGRRRWLVRVALVVGVVTAIVLAVRLGLVDFVTDADRLESFLTESGPLGPVVYVLAFTAVQPLSLPGGVLIVPATLVWSGPTVFLLSWIGGMTASTVGFVLARWLARDWVQERLPDRLRSWDDRLASRGTRAVIVLRLLTGYAPAADWVLGISAVTVRQFLVGTAIGLVPTTAAFAFLGDDAIRLVERLPVLAALVVVVGVAVAAVLRRRRDRDQAPASEAAGSIGGPPS